MKRTLLSVKLFILVAAVMLGASVTGCGTKGLLENEDGTQSDAMNEEPGQGGNGVGRYIGTTVYEGSEFYDLTQMQTLEDGQIVLLNCYSMEKLVSEDRGSTWHVETDDALSAALAEHDPADTAIAKDGTGTGAKPVHTVSDRNGRGRCHARGCAQEAEYTSA